MANQPYLSIVTPTRNEADNVMRLAERLQAALHDVDFEICYVDDSDDETPAVLARLAESRPGRIRYLHREGPDRRGGLSTAIVAGLRMARGRYICSMDSDLQHPPERVPAMLRAAEEGADVVVASRYVKGGSAAGLDSPLRHLVSRASAWLTQLLFAETRKTHDPGTGFFLCRRDLIDGVEFRPVGFKMLTELLICLPGVRVKDVPMRMSARAYGASNASVKQGVDFLRHLLSLFVHVEGSARYWKFSLIGALGFALFLGVFGIGVEVAHLTPKVAFVPALTAVLACNTLLHQSWTYADLRGASSLACLRWSVVSDTAMFGTFGVLDRAGAPLPAAAIAAVIVAAVVRVGGMHTLLRRQSAGRLYLPRGGALERSLTTLAQRIAADRVTIVPADGPGDDDTVTAPLVAEAVAQRRALLRVLTASYKPQRRTNVETFSAIVAPVVEDGAVVAVVVAQRRAPQAFTQATLDLVVRTVNAEGVRLVTERPADRVRPSAPELVTAS